MGSCDRHALLHTCKQYHLDMGSCSYTSTHNLSLRYQQRTASLAKHERCMHIHACTHACTRICTHTHTHTHTHACAHTTHTRTCTHTHTQHTPLLNGVLHTAEGGIHHIENGGVVLGIKLFHFGQDSFLCQKNRVVHFITKGRSKNPLH